jgi:uroporphyrinogen-III synthase
MRRPEGPLAGRVVLVTRPAGRTGPLARRLRALGARVETRATIAFAPPRDPLPARRALERLADYDWLVFTSATGAERFAVAAAGAGVAPRPRGRVAAIGGATAGALRRAAGIAPEVIARERSARGLAASLRGSIGPGARVLIVQPEQARDELAAALRGMGAVVEAVAFYRTVGAREAGAAARGVIDGRYDVVVFTAPSTLAFLLEAGGRPALHALRAVSIVAIGRATADAVESAGLAAAEIASEPTAGGIARAVLALGLGPR